MSDDNDRPLDRVGKALRAREVQMRMSADLDEATDWIKQHLAQPRVSPFEKHRDLLLNADYSAAGALQQFVLSLYNSATTQFQASRISNFDDQHMAIFLEFARSYHRNVENDEAFMQVCRQMWLDRKRWGVELLERQAAHQAIDPSAYSEGSERDWREQRDWLERQVAEYQAKGWIE